MSSNDKNESADNPQHIPSEEDDDLNDATGEDDNHYVYRDFADVPCSDPQPLASHPAPNKLPAKLNAILSDPDLSSIITWQPHGRSWRIIDRHRFTKEVLPQYFDHSSLNSFVRLVNAWGFRRVTSGVDSDSYYHELFLRGMRHLHVRMKRLLSNEKKAPVKSTDQCPNFYQMPLPNQNLSVAASITTTPQNVASSVTNHMDVASLGRNFQVNPPGINQQMMPSIPNHNSNTQGMFPQSNPYITNMLQAIPQLANNTLTSQQQQQQQQSSQLQHYNTMNTMTTAQMSSLTNTIAQQYQYNLQQHNLLAQQAMQAASLLQQNLSASPSATFSYPQTPANIFQQSHGSNLSSVTSNSSSYPPTNPVVANLINLLCNPVQPSASQESNSQIAGNVSNQILNPVQVIAPAQDIEQRHNQLNNDAHSLNTSSENQPTESSIELNSNEDENNHSKAESSE